MTAAHETSVGSHPLRPFDAMEQYRRLRTVDLQAMRQAVETAIAQVARDCVACGGAASTLLFQKEGFHFARCPDCGCIFVNPVPTPELIAWYYDKSSSLEYFHRHVLQPSLPRRRPIFAERVRQLSKHLNPGDRILEIGSSIGLFIEAAKNAGFDVSGIEPNAQLAKSTSATYGVPVANCFVEEFEPQEAFDAVVLWEVIEHLVAPSRVLQKLHTLLKPSGVLAMTLPNIAGLEFRLLGKDHEMFEAPSHLNYFSPETIALLLKRHGFNVVALTTPGILDFANIMTHLRRSREHVGLADEISGAQPIPDIGGAFLLWLEEYAAEPERHQIGETIADIVKRTGSSGNMFVVARK